jgi:hypothetical protein
MLAVFAGACKKNLLDQYPESKISDAQYWNTPNDLQLFTNNYYQSLPSYNGYGNIGIYSLDVNSDNIIAEVSDTRLNGQTIVPATGGGWATSDWTVILSANYFLAHYPKVLQSYPWSQVKVSVGETLFFRAWFYFNKLRAFGNLPWINKVLATTDSSLLYSTRLSRKVITDSIVQDLDSAAAYLPSKPSAQSMRVYKELALAFKSRVCLYEGTWEKYHQGDAFGVTGENGTTFLQKAADAAGQVIQSGLFSLDNVGVQNGYWQIFNQISYAGSKEVMFWRAYNLALIVNNWPLQSNTGNGMGITKRLVDTYLCTDGLPIAQSLLYKGDDSIVHLIANRDPRLAQTIYKPGDAITNNAPNGVPPVIFSAPTLNQSSAYHSTTGYQIYKGHLPDFNSQVQMNGTQGLIFIRYAEVLLNEVEALAELGTIQQSDIDKTINLLRSRVGMPALNMAAIVPDPNWDFPGLSPIINEVRRERRVELACEGFRLDDVLRWAGAGNLIVNWKPLGAKFNQWATLLPTVIPGKNIYLNAAGYIEPYQKVSIMQSGYQFNLNRDYLSPLPLDQLTLNPNLKQNPGWQ